MTVYVVDASVAAKWFLEEEYSAESLELLSSQNSLHAPDWFLLEVDHVLCKKIRRGELSVTEGEEIREALDSFPVRQHRFGGLRDLAFVMACRLGRGLYDCLYLSLARQLGGKMVTADRKFLNALSETTLAESILWIEDVPTSR